MCGGEENTETFKMTHSTVEFHQQTISRALSRHINWLSLHVKNFQLRNTVRWWYIAGDATQCDAIANFSIFSTRHDSTINKLFGYWRDFARGVELLNIHPLYITQIADPLSSLNSDFTSNTFCCFSRFFMRDVENFNFPIPPPLDPTRRRVEIKKLY